MQFFFSLAVVPGENPHTVCTSDLLAVETSILLIFATLLLLLLLFCIIMFVMIIHFIVNGAIQWQMARIYLHKLDSQLSFPYGVCSPCVCVCFGGHEVSSVLPQLKNMHMFLGHP